jgi:hypothetical protein
MILTARTMLVVYIIALIAAVAIIFTPNVVPEDGTIVLVLLGFQLTYPLFLWFTVAQSWKGAWRALRLAHGIVIVLVLLAVGLSFLTTPDVSGFTS